MIDAHIHLAGSDIQPGLLEEGDRFGIKLFVCSSIANFKPYPTLEEVRKANDDMVSVITRHPQRIAGYCYVNPRHGPAALSEFRRCYEDHGMVGLKLWVATLCDDPLVFPLIEQAIAYRAPVLLHAWNKTVSQLPYESTAVHVAHLASRYPEARLIMAHLDGRVENAMNLIEPYPNVYTDTSGTPIGGAEVSIAVKRLGSERVIFGSDLPIACLASNIGKVAGAVLEPEQFQQVMGGNMERLLSEVLR